MIITAGRRESNSAGQRGGQDSRHAQVQIRRVGHAIQDRGGGGRHALILPKFNSFRKEAGKE
ncbi:MAG: hypothetical protein M3Y33_13335 [Actinomycetota bacterium]|nr:hypothetical protein [Actinomycetota bacterium]